MSDTTTTPKKRGRPKGPRPALTSAQRMERARERVKAALWDLELIADLPDNLLPEVPGPAYRSSNVFAIVECARVMLDRLNKDAAPEKRLHMAIVWGDKAGRGDVWLRQTALDTVTDKDTVTVTEKESEDTDTVTDIQPIASDTVTETPPLNLSPPKRKDYPDWIKAKAVAMHRAGESRESISAMLIERFGKAPDVTNWRKTLRRWEASNPTASGS